MPVYVSKMEQELDFEDIKTVVVKADLLSLCIPGQFIETPKSPTNCEYLHWWVRCYPNSNNNKNENHVSVFIYTSIGDIDAKWTMTIDRSDIKDEDDSQYKDPMNHGYPRLASHEELRSGSIIQNGVFVIRCKVTFKVNLDKIQNNSALVPISEDSCIVKLDRNTLATYKTGQQIIEKKQTIDGVTWWIQYYPCGYREEDEGYVSVLFYITGGPINMECSCAMSIGGIPIQKAGSNNFEETDNWGLSEWFSHKQCRLADHKNDIIDLMCKVKITKRIPKIPTNLNQKTIQHSLKNSITILGCQLEDNEVGEFDSTPKTFAEGSDKHKWQLLCYPAGDTPRSKRHISLILEASTTETKTVILSGVIKIKGTEFEKKFNMLVEEDSNRAFPKLISHEELRRIGGIIGSEITIECDASFETKDF